MERLTQEQAIIIMGYTGITVGDFSAFHEDVEKRLGRPVFTHELACKEVWEQIKEAYYDDFISLCPREVPGE